MNSLAMDKWIIFAAMMLAVIAAVHGARCVHQGIRSRWTAVWLLFSFFVQLAVLSMRSQMRGSCPLVDTGEMFVFSAWSLTMCYLAVGSVYRVSLLGVFTAPLVSFLLGLALIPGMMDVDPEHAKHTDVWRAFHAAFSVLAYGALGLSSVAAVMFLVLNQQLKDAHLTTGLFRKLPPAKDLIFVVRRLLVLGFAVLTLGVICGVMMQKAENGPTSHLLMAVGLWLAYGALLVVTWWRGLPPKKLALASVVLFVFSLLMFLVL
jgi:ABC-type uncharacterized transport system permease subunit